MRWSKYFLQTVREVPGDAEAISHILLTRAGMMRRVAAGIYSLTPLGLRSTARPRRSSARRWTGAGFHEVELPILQPRELWEESGRWDRYASEEILFHLEGPQGRRVLPRADGRGGVRRRWCASGVTSYRQLPFTLYQIRTKFRDEIRPRFGLMRGREFLMYDGYSFDADADGLDVSYQRAGRRVPARLRSAAASTSRSSRPTRARSAAAQSQEFMVLAETGEDAVVRCAACGYGANLERAQTARRPAPWEDETVTPLVEVADARARAASTTSSSSSGSRRRG